MPGVLDSAAKRRRGVRPRHQRLLRNSGALTTVEQVCRNPVPQARNNRSPARSRRRSAGLSGKFDRSPKGRHHFVTASSAQGKAENVPEPRSGVLGFVTPLQRWEPLPTHPESRSRGAAKGRHNSSSRASHVFGGYCSRTDDRQLSQNGNVASFFRTFFLTL